MQYKVCPDCGAHLDHGEPCDCKKEETAPLSRERPLAKIPTASLSAERLNVNPRKERAAYG